MRRHRRVGRTTIATMATTVAVAATIATPARAADDLAVVTDDDPGIGSFIVGGVLEGVVDTISEDPTTQDEPIAGLGGDGAFTTWGSDVNVRAEPTTDSAIVTTLSGPTPITVSCQTQGELVEESGYSNDWWSYVPDLGGYLTNIYVDTPDSQLPGVAECDTGVDLLADDYGVPGGAPPEDIEYVALGDSYASGVGGGAYYILEDCGLRDFISCPDDIPDLNIELSTFDLSCHVSSNAYPVVAAMRLDAFLEFAACHGATIPDVYTQLKNARTRNPVVLKEADVISVQVGGNDVGFQRVLRACGTPWNDVADCWSAVNNAQKQITDELPDKLDGLYDKIRKEAPSARVVVVGYPKLFTAKWGVANPGDCDIETAFSWAEQMFLNETAELLRDTLRDRAEAHDFDYIDAIEIFAGHETCSDEPWIHANTWTGDRWWESYHPTPAGYAAYAKRVDDYLAG